MTWTNEPPSLSFKPVSFPPIEIDCGVLPTPVMATKELDTGTKVDGVVKYACKEKGYEISGSEMRKCLSTGVWSGFTTSCKRKYLTPTCTISAHIHKSGKKGTLRKTSRFLLLELYVIMNTVKFRCWFEVKQDNAKTKQSIVEGYLVPIEGFLITPIYGE